MNDIDESRGGVISRRELLVNLARAGASAPLALSAALAAQTPSAPRNLRFASSPAAWDPSKDTRAVLRPQDLTFLGFIRFAASPSNLQYVGSALGTRRVNGEIRVFIQGNVADGRPVLEYALPDADPNPQMNLAPIAPFRTDWGSIQEGRMLTGSTAGGRPGGYFWDEARQVLWWSYGDGYAPNQHHPTIGASVLHSNGTFTSYGPWRTQWHCQRTRGAFTAIPEAFIGHTGGKRIGIMAAQASGNAMSPFGAILSGIEVPDPFTTPPDVLKSSSYTIGNHGLILHDIEHRQARDTNYRGCGWKELYDCSAGISLNDGIAQFGSKSTSVGENDTMTSCAWVDLPDKRGVLYFGQLVTTPEGYSAPGDPDGFVHMWYGDPGHATKSNTTGLGFKNGHCCHGQDDPWWPSTGPGAHMRVPMGWIYDPADFVSTAQGKVALYGLTPKHTFQWKKYVPQLWTRYPSFIWGSGAWCDPATRRIYVLMRKQDTVTMSVTRPAIMAFKVD